MNHLDFCLESISPAFRYPEQPLRLRRDAFQLRFSDAFFLRSQGAPAVGQLWVQTEKVARKAEHLQTAYSAVLQTSEWQAPAAFIQQAKLLKMEDQPYKVVLKLDQNLNKNPVQTNHGSVDGLNEICTCDYAKVSSRVATLQRVRWMDVVDHYPANKFLNIMKRFVKKILGRFFSCAGNRLQCLMVDTVMLAPKSAWLARSQIQNVCAGGHQQISTRFPLGPPRKIAIPLIPTIFDCGRDAQQLSARIMSLEQLLHAVDPTLDLNNLPKPNLSFPSQSSNSQSFLPQFMASKLPPTLLPPNCTAGPNHYIGPHSGFNFLGAGTDFGTPNLPPWNQGTRYPPDIERNLIKIYFQHSHLLVPIVHPTTFYALCNSELTNNDLTFWALCLLMLSVAGRWSSDPRVQLDLAGQPQLSQQFSGFHFLYAGYLGIFKLNDHRTPLTPAGFCTLNPCLLWLTAIYNYECGPHQEVHRFWNADPLQDYLRRQAFYQLYEHAQEVRCALLRTALLQEKEFNVEPAHVNRRDQLGIFVNPYSIISPAVQEAYIGFNQARVSLWRLGSLRSILHLLFKLQQKVSKRNAGGGALLKSFKSLIDQPNLNAGKWLNNIPGDSERKTTKTNPQINKDAELAILSIEEMNKLQLQNMLTARFYWLPKELFLPISLLANIKQDAKVSCWQLLSWTIWLPGVFSDTTVIFFL
ncbi:uncharacterized protein VP01_1625g12 [Puccinia sorghi]|uniref:Transcription factor domain-containing protein n=1 Tax=Puccinia sorghi TaxID=27349 RepID=A0A0L6VGY7_9BASI|nr:uncharacterized protein VP01_1625g12 [Puccinia sorghi]